MKIKYLMVLVLGVSPLSHAEVTGDAERSEVSVDTIDESIDVAKKMAAERYKVMRAEKDPVRKKELYFEGSRSIKMDYKKVFELAKKTPKSAAAVRGISWGYSGLVKEDKIAARELLFKYHMDNEGILKVVEMAAVRRELDFSQLSGLIKTSKNEKVQQGVTLVSAMFLDAEGDKVKESLALYKKLLEWPKIAETNPGIYRVAESNVFLRENLTVGSVAPNIIGTDQDDKEFQLADYRGKVVLIDFWGMW